MALGSISPMGGTAQLGRFDREEAKALARGRGPLSAKRIGWNSQESGGRILSAGRTEDGLEESMPFGLTGLGDHEGCGGRLVAQGRLEGEGCLGKLWTG